MIELSLGPLDFAEIRELTANIFVQGQQSAIPDSLVADIFQRSGGLPVYAVQVLENIKRMGTLHLVEGTLEWTADGQKQKVG
jgi:predicted ATPase